MPRPSRLDHDSALDLCRAIREALPTVMETDDRGCFRHCNDARWVVYEAANRVATAWATGDNCRAADLKVVRKAEADGF